MALFIPFSSHQVPSACFRPAPLPVNFRHLRFQVHASAAVTQETQHADVKQKKKVSMVSLGCPKNLVDGETRLADY